MDLHTEKEICFTITYEKQNKGTEVLIKKTAEIAFSISTSFSDIASFLDNIKSLFNSYRFCAKHGLFCDVNLSVAAYKYGKKVEDLEQRSFDYWSFKGIPDERCEGLYLTPDTRYTNQEHDIYIDFSESLLNQLAGAGI